jgi:hypothetical protein
MPNGLYEVIVYENSAKRRYNNCEHTKIMGHPNLTTYCWDLEYCTPYVCDGKSRQITAVVGGYAPRHLNDWAQTPELNAEAFLTMKPSLSSGFSLTNFLLELRDLKQLFKLVDKSKTVIKNIGSGYLNYQFGWKLLIADLEVMINRLWGWQRTLEDYLSKQGVPMVRHYAKTLAEEDVEELVSSYTSPWSNELGETYCKAHIKSVYHATMRFTYSVPDVERELSKVKAFLEIWGLNISSSVVWEAIPFSFVVDWFLGVGDYLASTRDRYLESKVKVIDYCTSIKTTEVGCFEFILRGVPQGSSAYTASYYKRTRELPNYDGFGLSLTDRFGTKQCLLSAALLVA